MSTYSYAQLEALWIQAGGDPNVAGLMAAIGLAESSGDSTSMNYTDNNGTQTSVGLWQVSSGTHNYDPSWTTPLGNAREAVAKYKTQGLSAWGTYDTGAYKQYYQGNVTPSTVDAASGLSSLAPYSPTTNPTVTLSGPELAQTYGFAYSMLTSIPDLNTIFTEAVANQWSATRFTAALMATKWYQTHSAAQRAFIAEGFADPTTQQQQIQSQLANVQSMAAKFGMDVPANIMQQLAQQYLQNGWNDTQLQDAMSKYIQYNQYGGLGGSSGQIEMTLRNLANNNGVVISNPWILNVARAIADNTTSIEDAESYLRSQAEKLFPQYGSAIKAGQNLSDLAAPYMTDYQKILEVSPNQTTLFDPTIVKALQFKDPTGKTNALPLWQFDNQLRQDPRWKKTQNAQDSTMAVAHQVLQSFGFAF